MSGRRWFFLLLGAGGLFLVYFFQDYLDFYSLLQFEAPRKLHYQASYQPVEHIPFIINKALRYLLNDLFSIALIFAIFAEKKYVRFSVWVMLFGLLLLLPIYLFLYLSQPEGFSSMISHLHRVVMNPVLMLLLIPAFLAQRYRPSPSRA